MLTAFCQRPWSGVVSERNLWKPVSDPCPSQRPTGSPLPVPRMPQLASRSAPQGARLAFWKRKREGGRGQVAGGRLSPGVLAAWPGRRVSSRCPLRPGSGRAVWPPTLVGAAGFPRGWVCSHTSRRLPGLSCPCLSSQLLPAVMTAPGRLAPRPAAGLDPEGGSLTRATALLPPDALFPGAQVAGVRKVPSTDPKCREHPVQPQWL